jgi:hypothetical protein
MSNDLKQRLLKVEGGNHYGATVWYKNPDGPEAVDRIEQLEAALLEIEIIELDPRCSGQSWVETLRVIARKALEGKDE